MLLPATAPITAGKTNNAAKTKAQKTNENKSAPKVWRKTIAARTTATAINQNLVDVNLVLIKIKTRMQPNDQKLSHAAGDSRQPEIRSENCQA